MELIVRENYNSVFDFTTKMLPQSIHVNLWLNVQLNNPVPPMYKPLLYADVWPEPNVIFCVDIISEYHGFKDVPIVVFWSKFSDDRLLKFLQGLDEEIKMTAQNSCCLFGGIPDYQTNMVKKFFGNRGTCQVWPNYQFFMTPEKQNLLMQMDINLPNGYYFDKLNVKEASFVNDTWPHKFPGSLPRIEYRIQHLPNVAVRVNGTGELASFEIMHDEHGFMNHLYTLNEHRRKGLAKKVEERLAQIIIDQNYIPFKYVVYANVEGKAMTDRSTWWTDMAYLGEYALFTNETTTTDSQSC